MELSVSIRLLIPDFSMIHRNSVPILLLETPNFFLSFVVAQVLYKLPSVLSASVLSCSILILLNLHFFVRWASSPVALRKAGKVVTVSQVQNEVSVSCTHKLCRFQQNVTEEK